MTKRDVIKFIKNNFDTLTRFSAATASGRLTRDQQKEYITAYRYIIPKADVCFTCGRSAQVMGRRMLSWYEDNKPKKKK